MRNNKFWDECSDGSIRKSLAEFIDASPTVLSKLKGEKYYAVEDAIIEFIEANKEEIYHEVEKEYRRDDVCTRIDGKSEFVFKHLPLEIIDTLVADWQDILEDDEDYYDAMWNSLNDSIYGDIFSGVEDLTKKELVLYTAYLKDWFSCHDFPHEIPVCPDEFFECEMNDEECREYYEGLAAALESSEE